ncbi:hypothetical protein GCM10017709_34930 [Glutamicibacter nicotianae]
MTSGRWEKGLKGQTICHFVLQRFNDWAAPCDPRATPESWGRLRPRNRVDAAAGEQCPVHALIRESCIEHGPPIAGLAFAVRPGSWVLLLHLRNQAQVGQVLAQCPGFETVEELAALQGLADPRRTGTAPSISGKP